MSKNKGNKKDLPDEALAQSGYKKTKLGWIPEEWRIEKMAELIHLVSGQHLLSYEYNLEANGVPYFTGPTDVQEDVKDVDKWTTKGKKHAILGDILVIVKGSGVGKIFNLNLDKVAIGRQLMALRSSEINSSFLYYQLLTKKEHLKRLASGNMIPGLSRLDLKSLKIPLPPLPEQRKIAEILATWDTVIQKLKRLIDAKKTHQKALMQQLLSGKKRFAEFDDEVWKEVRLGEVTEYFSRRNKELIDARVYSVNNKEGFIYQSDQFEREVAGDDLRNHKIIKKNEFAYNPARINVGSIALFMNEIGIISSLYVCFSTNDKIEDKYLEFMLQTDRMKFDIERYGEGGVRIYLWYHLFAGIRIKLPSVKEQKKIIQILSAFDSEIQKLESKLEVLQDQKKGLMQRLLTGKTRVTHLLEPEDEKSEIPA